MTTTSRRQQTLKEDLEKIPDGVSFDEQILKKRFIANSLKRPDVKNVYAENVARLRNADIKSKLRLIRKTLTSLSSNHAPSFKLQMYFGKMCEALNLKGSISLLPGAAIVSFDCTPETISLKLPGGLNLEKLELVEIVIDSACAGSYASCEDACNELENVGNLPAPYPKWLAVLAFGGLCIGATVMFGGWLYETIISFIVGSLFGVVLFAADLLPASLPTFDFWASVLFAGLVRAIVDICAYFFKASDGIHRMNLNFMAILLPAIIWILPGFMMTNGFIDYFYGNRALGISNIFNAFFVSFNIGIGIFVGFHSFVWREAPYIAGEVEPVRQRIYDYLCSNMLIDNVAYSRLPFYTNLCVTAVLFLSCIFFISITFNATPRQIPAILVVGSGAFFVESLLGMLSVPGGVTGAAATATATMPAPIRGFFGAFAAGSLASVFSALTKFSSTPLIYTGIVILAPGAWGARCAFYFLRSNSTEGSMRLFGMFSIATGLALGTILGRTMTFNKK